MPELGADDTRDHGECDDVQGVGVDPVALEVEVENDRGTDCREPEQQTEGSNVPGAKVDVRKHADFSISAGRFRFGLRAAFAGRERLFLMAAIRYPRIIMSLPEYVPPQKMEVLFSREQLADRVHALGTQISNDYAGQAIVLIGVLKGAAIFLSDLARSITVDNTFDFVAVSSYGRARVSSGQVKLIKDIDNPIEDKHVILVEDILDTGLTLTYLRQLMLQHKPASLKIASCLDKPDRRLVPIEADYVCFKIPNKFVVGYGMDFAERYRGVGDIRIYPETPAGH